MKTKIVILAAAVGLTAAGVAAHGKGHCPLKNVIKHTSVSR